MSEPEADSALDAGEATGASDGNPSLADSTPTPTEGGQEQGEKSRINGLMSLAQRRTAERDAALAEIEGLKEQLSLAANPASDAVHQPTQVELMFPERYAQSDDATDEGDPMDQPEPPVIYAGVHPARPDHAAKPVNAPASSPAAQFVRDQGEIAAMKRQLNAMGAAWYEGQKAQGLID